MIFGNKNRGKARNLIAMANTIAISSLTSFLDKFPDLEPIFKARGAHGPADWDFFMTVAGVGAALLVVGANPGEEDSHQFGQGLQQHLAKWDPNAPAAFDDLTKFTERNVSAGVDRLTTIGLWVLWNVKQATPTDDEMAMAPAVGRFLAASFQGWRDQL